MWTGIYKVTCVVTGPNHKQSKKKENLTLNVCHFTCLEFTYKRLKTVYICGHIGFGMILSLVMVVGSSKGERKVQLAMKVKGSSFATTQEKVV